MKWITELKDLDKYEETIYEYIGNASNKISYDAIEDIETIGHWLYDTSRELSGYADAIGDLDLYRSGDYYEDTHSYVSNMSLDIESDLSDFNDVLKTLKEVVEYIEGNLKEVEDAYACVKEALKDKLEEFERER